METTMTYDLTHDMLAKEWFPGSGSTGTVIETRLLGTTRRNPQFEMEKEIIRDLFKGEWPRISWTSRNIVPAFANTWQLQMGWACSYGTLPDITVEDVGNAQICEAARSVLKVVLQRIYKTLPDNTAESADNEQIFDAIQSLYLSDNKPRDRQIATRIIALYRDALAEDECILLASLRQFTKFFLKHREPSLPRIILTPNGTLRVRWIQSTGSFVAIEFTGKPLVQLVAEIPRAGGETARYFSEELVDEVVSYARAIGASFT
jgi:hypothetical protein